MASTLRCTWRKDGKLTEAWIFNEKPDVVDDFWK